MDASGPPDVAAEIERQKAEVGGRPFRSGRPTAAVPPLALVPFAVEDTGNSSPKLVRSSFYRLPRTVRMFREVHLPLSLVVCPFAPLDEGEEPPVVPIARPPSCCACGAFVSPAAALSADRRSFGCAICGKDSPICTDYALRLHEWERQHPHHPPPESRLGSVEFEVEGRGEAAAFFFLLDISAPARRSGIVELFVRNVGLLMSELQKRSAAVRVGLIAFDRTLHFLDFSTPARPRFCSTPDADAVFLPAPPDSLLVEAEVFGRVFETHLDSLLHSLSGGTNGPVCLLSALQLAAEVLRAAGRPGRVFVLQTAGDGHHNPFADLSNRPIRWFDLLPATPRYGQLGCRLAGTGISFDFFLCGPEHKDAASLEQLVASTGGLFFFYPEFHPESDGPRLVGDLRDVLRRSVAFAASVAVRHSPQLRKKGGAEGALGNWDPHSALHFEFELHQDFGPNDQAHVQVAVSYTTLEGARRVRALNLRLATSVDYEEVYGGVDLSALTAHWLQEAAARWVADWSGSDIRDALFRLVSLALFAYRRRLHAEKPADCLLVPRQLRLLPLFAAAACRVGVLDEREEAVDRRVFLLHAVCRMGAEDALRYVVPRVLDVRGAEGLADARLERPSFRRLQTGGVYVVENGVDAFLWIDDRADRSWLRDVFGCGDASRLAAAPAVPALPTRHSLLLRRLLAELNAARPRRLSLRVVPAFSPAARAVRRLLVEDAVDLQPAHSTVINVLHSNILRLLE